MAKGHRTKFKKGRNALKDNRPSAKLSYARIPVQKACFVLDAIRGKDVNTAQGILEYNTRYASEVISKLLKSAIANAEVKGYDASELYIAECYATEGPTMKRIQPRAQGRAYRILKRSSHIHIILDTLKAKEEVAEERVETVNKAEVKDQKVTKSAPVEEKVENKAKAKAENKVEEKASEKPKKTTKKKATEPKVKKEFDDVTAIKAGDVDYHSKYVLNINMKRIHTGDCGQLNKMNKENCEGSNETVETLMEQGYDPCDYCLKEYAERLKK